MSNCKSSCKLCDKLIISQSVTIVTVDGTDTLGIRTRTRYSTRVSTNAVGGVFKSLGGISCYPTNALASLPVPTTATPAVASFDLRATPSKVTKTVTTTKKEVVANE